MYDLRYLEESNSQRIPVARAGEEGGMGIIAIHLYRVSVMPDEKSFGGGWLHNVNVLNTTELYT